MAMSKTEAIKELENNKLSNQQALVTKISGSSETKRLKRVIPAGKNLLESINRETLPKAVYIWLRHCAYFTEFTISFVRDLEETTSKTNKVLEFNTRSSNIEWDVRGKRWLAEKIAENLLKENVIAVQGDREGLYVTTSKTEVSQEDENWEPYVEFLPFRPRDLV